MSDFLSSIANEKRLNMILCIHEGRAKSVNELLSKCDLSQSALSQHLKILRDARIVTFQKDGKHCIYSIRDTGIIPIVRSLLSETLKRK